MDNPQAFLVFLEPEPEEPLELPSAALGGGLHVCLTGLTRSRLYHRLKARYRPDRLLVAPLSGLPKFKGLAPGALAALRQLSTTGETPAGAGKDQEEPRPGARRGTGLSSP
jgi:hypothetical protein